MGFVRISFQSHNDGYKNHDTFETFSLIKFLETASTSSKERLKGDKSFSLVCILLYLKHVLPTTAVSTTISLVDPSSSIVCPSFELVEAANVKSFCTSI